VCSEGRLVNVVGCETWYVECRDVARDRVVCRGSDVKLDDSGAHGQYEIVAGGEYFDRWVKWGICVED